MEHGLWKLRGMRNLDVPVRMAQTLAVNIAQAVVTAFGGGNGDPDVLHRLPSDRNTLKK